MTTAGEALSYLDVPDDDGRCVLAFLGGRFVGGKRLFAGRCQVARQALSDAALSPDGKP